MRRLAAAAAVLGAVAVGTPAASASQVSVEVRVAADRAVVVTARGPLAIDYRRVRPVGDRALYGVFVVGGNGARSGMAFAASLTYGDAWEGARVALPLTSDDVLVAPPGGHDGQASTRVLPAGTYTLYGVGGSATVGLSARGGVRVADSRATPRRRAAIRSARAALVAGVPPPVWDATTAGPSTRDRLIAVAQMFREPITPPTAGAVDVCLAPTAASRCGVDRRSSVACSHAQAIQGERYVDLVQCIRRYDVAPALDAATPVRVEAVSSHPVRSLTAFVVTWEPPPGG